MPSIRLLLVRGGPRKQIPDVRTVCAECQSDIAPDSKFCSRCHAPIVRRYCPGCSKLVPENTEQCPFCGASGKVQAKTDSNISSFVAIGAILCGLALFIISQNRDEVDPPDKAPAAKTVADVQRAILKSRSVPNTQIAPVSREENKAARLNIRGHKLIQEGKHSEAIPILRQAVKASAKGTKTLTYKYALYNLGHALRKTGRPKEAAIYLQQAVDLDPSWQKAESELGVARAEAAAAQPLVQQLPAESDGSEGMRR